MLQKGNSFPPRCRKNFETNFKKTWSSSPLETNHSPRLRSMYFLLQVSDGMNRIHHLHPWYTHAKKFILVYTICNAISIKSVPHHKRCTPTSVYKIVMYPYTFFYLLSPSLYKQIIIPRMVYDIRRRIASKPRCIRVGMQGPFESHLEISQPA